MNQLQGLERARFAKMKGTFAENEAYCSKQGDLTHFGEPFVGQGARTDRNEYYQLLKTGANDMELMEADFSAYARFRNATADYRSLIRPERTSPLEVILFYGEPGAGKTEFAIQQLGTSYYRLPLSDSFWLTPACGGKKMILIDEFRSNMKLALLLQLLDKYPIEVAKKGGFTWWLPDVVVITTNISPWNWYDYNNRDMEREALFRRFTGCYRFSKNPEKVPRPIEIDMENPADFVYAPTPVVRQNHFFQSPGMILANEGFNQEEINEILIQ